MSKPANESSLVKKPVRRVFSKIPSDITDNPELNSAMELLPKNYNFEIYKSLWRIRRAKAKRVALQFPEGLQIFACLLSDIFERFGDVDAFILGDVTYGACCIDDFVAKSLKCDLMVHYAHSCLVPITVTKMPTLYVFVEMSLNLTHLSKTLKLNFEKSSRLTIAGTIQFVGAIYEVVEELKSHFERIEIPQQGPLSKGEVLGCTSPKFDPDSTDYVIFVADGRFHLESIMINNPQVKKFYRYNPYDRELTIESYDFPQMMKIRKEAIDKARPSKKWGLILSTLGRQGNPKILNRIERLLHAQKKDYTVLLLSEILPEKLNRLNSEVDAWIQVGCPRLSIDWGYSFTKPLLNPFEAFVVLEGAEWNEHAYPMDFYSKKGKQWANYYKEEEREGAKDMPKISLRQQK